MIVDCHTHWGIAWVDRDGRDPSKWLAVLDQHEITHAIVLGHRGIEAVRRCPNVWACLCGPHAAAQREFFRRCDHSRILWGSDFGFGFADPIPYRLGLLRSLGLSDTTLNAMLAENPARLLRIKIQ
jgi:predicted TIM-barrel fold metal-dependent hydrolase